MHVVRTKGGVYIGENYYSQIHPFYQMHYAGASGFHVSIYFTLQDWDLWPRIMAFKRHAIYI